MTKPFLIDFLIFDFKPYAVQTSIYKTTSFDNTTVLHAI